MVLHATTSKLMSLFLADLHNLHNTSQHLLMVPLSALLTVPLARFVAKLATKPLIASFEWTTHIKGIILQLNWQPR
jgi:hypothetical protein